MDERSIRQSNGEGSAKGVRKRMLERYERLCSSLDEHAAVEIVARASNVLRDAPDHIRESPRRSVFWALQTAFSVAENKNADPKKRRRSLETVRALMRDVEQHNNWRQQAPSQQVSETVLSATGQQQPALPNAHGSSRGGSVVYMAGNESALQGAATNNLHSFGCFAREMARMHARSSVADQADASLRPAGGTSGSEPETMQEGQQQTMSATSTNGNTKQSMPPALATNCNSTPAPNEPEDMVSSPARDSHSQTDKDAQLALVGRPQHLSNQTATNGTVGNDTPKPSKINLLQECLSHHQGSSSNQREHVSFLAKPDSKKIAGALCHRDATTTIRFSPPRVPKLQALEVLKRFEKWDPFWQFSGPAVVGLTGRVNQPASPSSDCPSTAMQLKITPSVDMKPADKDLLQLIPFPVWNDPKRKKHVDCGYYLIFRTLESNYSGGGGDKLKRADGHLWPKGTFLQVDGNPCPITQRKQQKNFPDKWLHANGPSDLFDVTAVIQDPRQMHTVEMCCFDEKPYFFCLSLSRYQSTDRLFQNLLDSKSPEHIHKCPRECGLSRVIANARESIVTLDGIDDGNDPGKGSFVFSFRCPISQVIFETPVRGQACKHFQCFDLLSFLETNAKASNNRWRCGCCENFLAVDELELCELTQGLLKENFDVISDARDRVLYDGTGHYRFLQPQKRNRQAKKQGTNQPTRPIPEATSCQAGRSNSGSPQSPDVIDLV